MTTETVVADTTYSILANLTEETINNPNPANQNSQVNGTRTNKFWNNVEFNDYRVGPGERRLKIWVEASGDVTSQSKEQKVNKLYTLPHTEIPTEMPETIAVITDTGAPQHAILVETYFEVWNGESLEYSNSCGQHTNVEEI